MIQSILSYDEHLLILTRTLIDPEYSSLIQFLGELVVLWCMIFLVGLWFYSIYKKETGYKYIALRIFFTIILVFVFYLIINLGIPKWRPSPQEVAGSIGALIPHPIDNSFPSGHALFSGAFLVGLLRYYRKGIILSLTIVFANITVVSRVLGGVHYPGDILGGLIIGIFGGFLLSRCITSKFMEKTIYPFIIRIMSWVKL
ncbi:phosphatase PAP2 family protein [Candidatus Gracilibacteria bacterium]|nr:phosphatase PAP2 family protein [Candidatus Gracilibacteria bacterium]